MVRAWRRLRTSLPEREIMSNQDFKDYIYNIAVRHNYTLSEIIITACNARGCEEIEVVLAISELLKNKLVLSKHCRLYKK